MPRSKITPTIRNLGSNGVQGIRVKYNYTLAGIKFYKIAWGGNQFTGARSLAVKLDAQLGTATKVMGIAGIVIPGVEAYDDYQTGNMNDLILHSADVAMGIIGVWGGPIGAGVSTIWFVGRVITSM